MLKVQAFKKQLAAALIAKQNQGYELLLLRT